VWSRAFFLFLRRDANRMAKGAWSCGSCCPFFAFPFPLISKKRALTTWEGGYGLWSLSCAGVVLVVLALLLEDVGVE